MDFKETAAWLLEQDHILILTHRRPDGDTLGCGIALCRALREQGKTAYMLFNEEMTPQFDPYVEGIWMAEGAQVDTVVSVDIAALTLMTDSAKPWVDRGIDLAIDHHPSHEGFGALTCLDGSRAACGELIYDIVRQWGPVSAQVALPLYVAISTDTGCFEYSNTTPATHRIVADLMETGIDFYTANHRHFGTKSLGRLKLESLLVDTMEVHDGGAIALAGVSLADMARLGTTESDAEDISSFLGKIQGVESAGTLRELKPGEWKISMRTQVLSATEICGHFGGGGHRAAAGGTIFGDFAQAKAVLMTAIRAVQHG